MNPLRKSGWGRTGMIAMLLWLTVAAMILSLAMVAEAATPAGTLLRSQASASFLDENGSRYQVSSNEVTTLIRPVTGIHLAPGNQKRYAVGGMEVVFPHVLTNTGNTSVPVRLTTSGALTNRRVVKDLNHSGQPQGQPEVNSPVFLKPGESVDLLLVGRTYGLKKNKAALSVDLLAMTNDEQCKFQSDDWRRCWDRNTDTVQYDKHKAYKVTKTMSTQNVNVGEMFKVQLRFERMSEHGASTLYLKDRLPMGIDYMGDGRLCDEDGYRCSPLVPGLKTIDGRTEVNFKTPKHKDDDEGYIEFSVAANTSSVGQTVFNTADFRACNGNGRQCTDWQPTNRVPVMISGPGVSINGSSYNSAQNLGEPVTVPSASAGDTVEFIDYLWNTGTVRQSYTVAPVVSGNTFPAGSTYCLSTSDECSQFASNPVVDVMDLAPGEYREVRLKVKLLNTVTLQKDGYFISLKASLRSSHSGQEVSDTVLNWLTQITESASSVDLTYERPVQGDASVPGKGPGPESEPVTILSGQPGDSVTFDALFVNNTGGAIDTYNLQLVSSSGSSLPEGVTAQFVDRNNLPTANTGSVKAGENALLKLVVSLPTSATDGNHDFHVVAVSPVTGAKDRLTVRITVSDDAGLALEPNGEGQVTPGSFITFAHRLTNSSNSAVDNLSFMLSDSLKSQGWQSVLYHDLDGDGVLSGSDTVINSPVSLAGNKTLHLLVKVFAPANASMGIHNVTTLTVISDDGQRLSVTDTSIVNTTSVVIIKEQAPWDCQGAVPVNFRKDAFPARPGTCVVYRLTAMNEGVEGVQNVVIHDAAPNFTDFYPHGGLPRTTGRQVVQPNVSGSMINAHWPDGLQPGESVALIFAIQIQ